MANWIKKNWVKVLPPQGRFVVEKNPVLARSKHPTLLLLIATGCQYWQFIAPLLRSAERFLIPHDTLLFTDCYKHFLVTHKVMWKDEGFPSTTLNRYSTFSHFIPLINTTYQHMFYTDIDALFVNQVGDILSDGITATLHPGYAHGQSPPYETRVESKACVTNGKHYFCGGLIGGETQSFLDMCREIDESVEADRKNGVLAIWHDESHLNRYLNDHPPAKILSPSYCYPSPPSRFCYSTRDYYRSLWSRDYDPILVCQRKTWKE